MQRKLNAKKLTRCRTKQYAYIIYHSYFIMLRFYIKDFISETFLHFLLRPTRIYVFVSTSFNLHIAFTDTYRLVI